MSRKRIFSRLVLREYLPMGGVAAAWGLTALAIGPAQAAHLLVAVILVSCARVLTSLNVAAAVTRRQGLSGTEAAAASAFVRRAEFASLAAGLAVLAALAGLLLLLGTHDLLFAVLVLATGYPARSFFGWRRGGQYFTARRISLAWAGAVLMLPVWLLDLGFLGAAAAFGIREWFALIVTRALPPGLGRKAPPSPVLDPLGWSELAALTYAQTRRLFAFRMSKALLAGVLGPFAAFVVRTGRGTGAYRRLDRFTPRDRRLLAAILIGSGGAGAFLFATSRDPVALVFGASLLRLSATALAMLAWSFHAPALPDDWPEMDDD